MFFRCAGDYVGPTCEDVLVRDFIGKSIRKPLHTLFYILTRQYALTQKRFETHNDELFKNEYLYVSITSVHHYSYVGFQINTIIAVTRTKVGVAAGGTCNVVFIFFLVVLGLLFFRERYATSKIHAFSKSFVFPPFATASFHSGTSLAKLGNNCPH